MNVGVIVKKMSRKEIFEENHHPDTKVNTSQQASFKWFIWGLTAVFYLYETMLRVSPSVMTQQLMTEFIVTSTSLGVLSSFYYYSYVPLQIPCGLLVDHFGIRKILTLSCLLCILGTLMFSQSETLIAAQIGRFLLGAGSACAFISCLKVSAEWFIPAQFALIAGLTNMMGTFGGLASGLPLASMINTFGWRETNFYLALAGIPILACLYFFLKQKNQNTVSFRQPHFKESFLSVAKNPQIWLSGIIGGFMYLPISAFAELWGVPFFMSAYNINNASASSISHLIFIGMALGSPFAAWMVRKMNSIKRVMILSSAFGVIFFGFIALAGSFPLSIAYILVISAGFILGGQVLCFTLSKNHASEAVSATAIGFTNALVMLSGIIFQPLMGHILDIFWNGQLHENGMRLYDISAYRMAIIAIPLCFVANTILLFFVKDEPKKSV